jgi:hypothetical protein
LIKKRLVKYELKKYRYNRVVKYISSLLKNLHDFVLRVRDILGFNVLDNLLFKEEIEDVFE